MNIYDIAQKAGVSIATVSRVINGNGAVSGKTRQKVENVMQEMGYTPNVFARGLMVNSMKTIGVMTIDVRDLYYTSAIHTIEVEARQKGYDVILCSTGEDIHEKRKYLQLLLNKRVDGIILVGSVFKEKSDNSHILGAAAKVPVVMINGQMEGANIYSVICDDSQGIYDTVQYLSGKGHSEIAYIYDVDTYSGMAKLAGFRKALSEKGLDASYCIFRASKGMEGGYEAADRILKSGRSYSAIISAEDVMAVGALKRLQEVNLAIPGDVAVTGYNNSILALCTTPELTSVDNKVEAISSGAIKMLIDALEGRNIPSRTVITPELVIRQSA
jgi:LacI family transcriptional regulator